VQRLKIQVALRQLCHADFAKPFTEGQEGLAKTAC